jgi:predicted phage terminase large subunit-like protein
MSSLPTGLPPTRTLPPWQSNSSISPLVLARALPSGLAHLASRGQWVTAPHLNILTQKLVDLEQRRITRLLVEMPPRHGKSNLCSQYFPAWYLGRNPNHNVILASYETGYASTWGEKARDTLSEYGGAVFGLAVRRQFNKASDWRIDGHEGRMRCVGVTGGITGRGANLLVIDDPIKDALEAASETYRNRAWNWYTSTARTRLEPNAVVVVIQTRWHQEDLIGRLRKQEALGGERWESLTLPAICEQPGDALNRQPGDALWPWRYTAEALLTLKRTIPEHWWNALYQQRPTPPGGALAKTIWFKPVHARPAGHAIRCRFWDVGGGEQEGRSDPDWTVGALVARKGHEFFIEDIIRVQMSSGDVDKLILQTAQRDGKAVLIREEQEPGSAGKAIINFRKRTLAGFNYKGVPSTQEKALRWQPMLIQAEVGNMFMVVSRWNDAFLAEVGDAPYGSNDDQLDAVSGAFAVAAEGSVLAASELLAVGGQPGDWDAANPRKMF